MTEQVPEQSVTDAAPVPTPPVAPAEDVAALKAELDRWKSQARKNEDRSKANHAALQDRDELLKAVADKIGIPYDGKPDPGVLTAELEKAQALAKQRAVELAVYTSASESGANASALLDSRDFMSRTAGLDSDSADFRDRVSDLVKEASANQRYQVSPAVPAAQPPPASSGGQFGDVGAGRLWTQADLDRATAPDADPAVLSKAISDGMLVNLGIGKPKSRHRR